MTKPKICELTGTEVGEVFTVRKADGSPYSAEVTELGLIAFAGTHHILDGNYLCDIINGKATIARKPRFSKYELGTLRLLYDNGMRWLAREESFRGVPNLQGLSGNARRYGKGWVGDKPQYSMPAFLFPQIRWEDDEPLDIEATLRAAGLLEVEK